ncbi:MAG TPA: low temperature requirement protein A [Acidimicrobiia bacterium]|nr:low temperature requirement protein A [Acidimicrobiia bacterium]
MSLARITPPRLRTLEEAKRTATWLELFYDLAFVAAVAVMGVRLAHDVTWPSIASYLGYFALVWWLWASYTFYADRYDTDDLIFRLLAGAQIVGVVLIAVSLSQGEAGSTTAFSIGYTAVRLILLMLYGRAYRHVPETRELVRGYLTGFGAAAVLWFLSIFVSPPARFWVWALAFAVDLATPYVLRKVQAAVPLDVSHLPERFGLFTILVLGEAIVAVTVGLGDISWQPATTLVGLFGLGTATCLWWIYFDHHEGSVVRRRGDQRNWRPTVWIYSHLPLAVAVAVFGLSVEIAITSADNGEYGRPQRWLLLGSIALALAAMATIQSTLVRGDQARLRRSIVNHRLVGIPIVLALGLIPNLGVVWTLGLVTAIATAEVVAGLVAANPAGLRAALAAFRGSGENESG